MATCLECEHYEKYEGDRKINGKRVVMFCLKYKKSCPKREGYSYSTNPCNDDFTPKSKPTCKECEHNPPDSYCGECEDYAKFTPKKPAEEKSCKTCRKREDRDNTCPPMEKCNYGNNYMCWQPIPKPKTDDEVGKTKMYVSSPRNCGKTHAYAEYVEHLRKSPVAFYDEFLTPKQKENKMKLTKVIFYPIRRYVATCVVIVTAWICIWLNPLVFFVAKMVKPEYRRTVREQHWLDDIITPWNSGDWKQIAVVWICAIAAVAGVILALYLYNQFCKKLCKMLGSE